MTEGSIVALILGGLGGMGWLTKIAYDIGRIKTMLCNRLDTVEVRAEQNAADIATLKAARPAVDG